MLRIKSVLGLVQQNSKQSKQKKSQTIYQDLKAWDKTRASLLELHLKLVQEILESIDKRVKQSQFYILTLQRLMGLRIRQMEHYCKNGVNNSQFFLNPSHMASYKPQHQLLKSLMMQQSQRELKLTKKSQNLRKIFEKLLQIKAEQCYQRGQDNNGQITERDADGVLVLKSNLRYLIDCDLPDIIEAVLKTCSKVSQAYSQSKDLYLPINQFIKMAEKQIEKHKQIGKQLVEVVGAFVEREKKLKRILRDILRQWVKEDIIEKELFQQQLKKQTSDNLIQEYYKLEQLLINQYHFQQSTTVADFLQNFKIKPFRNHQSLVIYSRNGFYNKKIETRIVLTEQGYMYLFRMEAKEPDFWFNLSKQTKAQSIGQLSLEIKQMKKLMLFREEVEFSFSLEFNLESDLLQLCERIEGLMI